MERQGLMPFLMKDYGLPLCSPPPSPSLSFSACCLHFHNELGFRMRLRLPFCPDLPLRRFNLYFVLAPNINTLCLVFDLDPPSFLTVVSFLSILSFLPLPHSFLCITFAFTPFLPRLHACRSLISPLPRFAASSFLLAHRSCRVLVFCQSFHVLLLHSPLQVPPSLRLHFS